MWPQGARFKDTAPGLRAQQSLHACLTNGVFLQLSEPAIAALTAKGWRFYTFIGGGARFMFAWDADPVRVDALAADIREACVGSQVELAA